MKIPWKRESMRLLKTEPNHLFTWLQWHIHQHSVPSLTPIVVSVQDIYFHSNDSFNSNGWQLNIVSCNPRFLYKISECFLRLSWCYNSNLAISCLNFSFVYCCFIVFYLRSDVNFCNWFVEDCWISVRLMLIILLRLCSSPLICFSYKDCLFSYSSVSLHVDYDKQRMYLYGF